MCRLYVSALSSCNYMYHRLSDLYVKETYTGHRIYTRRLEPKLIAGHPEGKKVRCRREKGETYNGNSHACPCHVDMRETDTCSGPATGKHGTQAHAF